MQVALQASSPSPPLSSRLRESPPGRSIELSIALLRGSTTPAPRTPETQQLSGTRAGTLFFSQHTALLAISVGSVKVQARGGRAPAQVSAESAGSPEGPGAFW